MQRGTGRLLSAGPLLVNKRKAGRSRAKSGSALVRRLQSFFGFPANERWAPAFLVLVTFCVVTLAFYSVLRRHDVELSFDQLSTLEGHVHSFGNHTVYVVDPSHADQVLFSLPHDDWAKISSKIDYIAILYDDIYAASSLSPVELIQQVANALEQVKPHGYGIALFPCGCLIHNVLFQHASTRFSGMECAMLPGFVFEEDAVRWVDLPVSSSGCAGREIVLGKPWYTLHSWKLDSARAEYNAVRQHLSQTEHADRPEPMTKSHKAS